MLSNISGVISTIFVIAAALAAGAVWVRSSALRTARETANVYREKSEAQGATITALELRCLEMEKRIGILTELVTNAASVQTLSEAYGRSVELAHADHERILRHVDHLSELLEMHLDPKGRQ